MSDNRPFDVRLKDIPIGAKYEIQRAPGAVFVKKFEPGEGPEVDDVLVALIGIDLFGDTRMESEWVFSPTGDVAPGTTCSNRAPGGEHERCRLHLET